VSAAEIDRIISRYRSPDEAGFISAADVSALRDDLVTLVEEITATALCGDGRARCRCGHLDVIHDLARDRDHADEILTILGLDPRTDAELAAGPLPKPKTEPRPDRTPSPARKRPPTRRRRQAYKQCVGCREVKPTNEFKGRSYRCRECA
jgi:hypothetical protein